jgi:hypothetical protein
MVQENQERSSIFKSLMQDLKSVADQQWDLALGILEEKTENGHISIKYCIRELSGGEVQKKPMFFRGIRR